MRARSLPKQMGRLVSRRHPRPRLFVGSAVIVLPLVCVLRVFALPPVLCSGTVECLFLPRPGFPLECSLVLVPRESR